ncbi:ATP synthase subunit b [compost metagenome]
MKLALNVLVLLLPVFAFAAGGEHHGEGVPKVVIYQLINVLILLGGLVYFTKDMIIGYFSSRKTEFLSAAQKSAAAREEAEKQFIDIKSKLENMMNTREETVKKAEAHADDLKKQILTEANEVSKRIRDEAELTAKLEVDRAQRELRQGLIKESVDAARMVLTKDIGAPDQQKLQNEFIKNIEVVSR